MMKAPNREPGQHPACDVGNFLQLMRVPYPVRLPVSALARGWGDL